MPVSEVTRRGHRTTRIDQRLELVDDDAVAHPHSADFDDFVLRGVESRRFKVDRNEFSAHGLLRSKRKGAGAWVKHKSIR